MERLRTVIIPPIIIIPTNSNLYFSKYFEEFRQRI